MTVIISNFTGTGGLDVGVQQVFGGRVIAHVENEDAPSRILAHHWPEVPNLGDITAVDWAAFVDGHPELGDLVGTYRPAVIMTGGFPCQDVSLAGLRRGLRDGTRSGLWSEFARAIDAVRPGLVVIENVRGLLNARADRQMESSPWGVGGGDGRPALRALGAVLGDLAELGYDARWCGLEAADAGAPHRRFRVFVLAWPREADGGRRGSYLARLAGSAPQDADGATRDERWLAAPDEAEGGRARPDAGRRGRASAPHPDQHESARELAERSGRATAPGSGRVFVPDADGGDRDRGEHLAVGGPEGRTPAPGDRETATCRDGEHRPDTCEHRTRRGAVPAGLWRRGLKPAAVAAARAVTLAADAERLGRERGRDGGDLGGTPSTGQGGVGGQQRDAALDRGAAPREGASPADADRGGLAAVGRVEPGGRDADGRGGEDGPGAEAEPETLWGEFAEAIARWEAVTGRRAPAPTAGIGRNGAHRLSPLFVEWMMGLQLGHVTGTGISANKMLEALGNGVVPQHVALACRSIIAAEVVAA